MGSLFPAAALLLALALAALTPQLPDGLPDAATRLSWERVAGTARRPDVEVEYELLVNPARPGLFTISRYRMTRVAKGAGGSEEHVRETEKLVWNPDPDRAPLRVYELVTQRPWWLLGLVQRRHWSELPLGTPRYRDEMFTMIGVYGLQNPGALH
jgi:hypothetical protein